MVPVTVLLFQSNPLLFFILVNTTSFPPGLGKSYNWEEFSHGYQDSQMSGLLIIPWGIFSNAWHRTKVLLWGCLGVAVVWETWQEWKGIFLWFLANILKLLWLGLAFEKHFLVCDSSGCSDLFAFTLVSATIIIFRVFGRIQIYVWSHKGSSLPFYLHDYWLWYIIISHCESSFASFRVS